MSRLTKAAKNSTPAPAPTPGSFLPRHYSPAVAGYAAGPFLTPELVTPSAWRWKNTRTYVIRHTDGRDYRAVRVESDGEFVGYWAVELLGTPLTSAEE